MDEQTKKDFTEILEKTLDKKFEEKFIPLFNQGFEEIVLPHIERIDKGMDRVEQRVEGMNRKLEVVSDKQFEHGQRLKDLEQSQKTT